MKTYPRSLGATATVLGGLAFLVAAPFALRVSHAQNQPPAQRLPLLGPSSVKVRFGQPIPEFVLTDVATGKNIGFGTFSAGKKATVIIFMSTHCPVSNAYEQRIEQLATKYTPQGVQFAGIFPDVGEDAAQVANHAKEKGLTFLCLRDDTAKEAKQFTASVTPEVYVTDAQGNLVFHGPVDDSQEVSGVTHTYLADTLDAVLAGKPVPVRTKRAFGCQIHRPTAQ